MAESAPTPRPAPSVGRIVHYHDAVHGVCPAIVTLVDDDGVFLTVFFPHSLPGYTNGPVPFSEHGETDTWTWPPRV